MKHVKGIIGLVVALCICFGVARPIDTGAATVKLSKKSIVMVEKENYTLRMIGTKKNVKWSVSDSKVAAVNSKGIITAKAEGKTVITAKTGGKKYSCDVKVLPYMDQALKQIARSESIRLNTALASSESLQKIYKIVPMKVQLQEFYELQADYMIEYEEKHPIGMVTKNIDVYDSKIGCIMGDVSYLNLNYQIEKAYSGEEIENIIALAKEIAAGNYSLDDHGQIYLNSWSWLVKGKTYNLKLHNTEGKPVWSSSNNKVVSVDKNGKVKALKNGKAVITAKLDGKTYKCSCTVGREWSERDMDMIVQLTGTSHGYKYLQDFKVMSISYGRFVVEQQQNDFSTVPVEVEGQIKVHVQSKNVRGQMKEYDIVFAGDGTHAGMMFKSSSDKVKTLQLSKNLSKNDVKAVNDYIEELHNH